jgi:hypothetical protein
LLPHEGASVGGRDSMGQPVRHLDLVNVASGHRQHLADGVIGGDYQLVRCRYGAGLLTFRYLVEPAITVPPNRG